MEISKLIHFFIQILFFTTDDSLQMFFALFFPLIKFWKFEDI